jgi:hypothetical protein
METGAHIINKKPADSRWKKQAVREKKKVAPVMQSVAIYEIKSPCLNQSRS